MGSHRHKLMAYNHVQRQVEFPIIQHIKNRFETIKLYNYKPQSQTVITGHYRTITTLLRLKTLSPIHMVCGDGPWCKWCYIVLFNCINKTQILEHGKLFTKMFQAETESMCLHWSVSAILEFLTELFSGTSLECISWHTCIYNAKRPFLPSRDHLLQHGLLFYVE